MRIRIQLFTFMLIGILLFTQMCGSGSSFFTFMLIRILLFTQMCGSGSSFFTFMLIRIRLLYPQDCPLSCELTVQGAGGGGEDRVCGLEAGVRPPLLPRGQPQHQEEALTSGTGHTVLSKSKLLKSRQVGDELSQIFIGCFSTVNFYNCWSSNIWMRIDLKCRIKVRIETYADPQQCLF